MSGLRRLHARSTIATAACVTAALLFVSCGAASAQGSPAAAHSSRTAAPSFAELAARARAADDGGRLDEAARLFHQTLVLNPRWAEGWWSLGTIDYDGNQYALAASAFRKVVALDPRHGTARAMLGLCEFELGQDASALQDIEASKGLGILDDPQLRNVVLYHEGMLLQRAGRFEAAEEALASLCLGGVKSEDLTQTFGMVVLHMRDPRPPAPGTQAADMVEHLGRGACLSAQKNYDAARQEYEFAARQYPHFPFVHYAYGRFLLEAHDRASAIHEFQQEIAEAPNSILPRLQIAAAEYRVDSAAGLPYAEQALHIAPQTPFAHYLLGLLLLDTSAYQKAIPHLEIARKAFPQEAKIVWSLGVAYALAGRPREAAQARAAFVRLRQAAGQASESASPGETPDSSPPIKITDGATASEAAEKR